MHGFQKLAKSRRIARESIAKLCKSHEKDIRTKWKNSFDSYKVREHYFGRLSRKYQILVQAKNSENLPAQLWLGFQPNPVYRFPLVFHPHRWKERCPIYTAGAVEQEYFKTISIWKVQEIFILATLWSTNLFFGVG